MDESNWVMKEKCKWWKLQTHCHHTVEGTVRKRKSSSCGVDPYLRGYYSCIKKCCKCGDEYIFNSRERYTHSLTLERCPDIDDEPLVIKE